MMVKCQVILISFMLLVVGLCISKLPDIGDQCNTTVTGLHGICTLPDDCPVPLVFTLSMTHGCANNHTNILVCCVGATLNVFKTESVSRCKYYASHLNCATGPLSKTELIDNRFKSIKDFPHIAVILYKQFLFGKFLIDYHHGSLISSRYVLCAAASAIGTNRIPAAVEFGKLDQINGVTDETVQYNIEKWIVHPKYDPPSIYNDIAVLKLWLPVKFSIYVRPICLPDRDIQSNIVHRINYEQRESTLLEDTRDPLVRYERRFVPNYICNTTYDNILLPKGINDDFICTTSKELGDSIYDLRFDGAPITIDHPSVTCSRVLLGVSLRTQKHRIADIAIKVYNYLEWIENTIWADGMDI